MEPYMATQVAESWWRRFNDACVPARPVYTVPQALSHTQIVKPRHSGDPHERARSGPRCSGYLRARAKLNGEPLLANRIMDGSGASTLSDRFAAFNAAVRSPVE